MFCIRFVHVVAGLLVVGHGVAATVTHKLLRAWEVQLAAIKAKVNMIQAGLSSSSATAEDAYQLEHLLHQVCTFLHSSDGPGAHAVVSSLETREKWTHGGRSQFDCLLDADLIYLQDKRCLQGHNQ